MCILPTRETEATLLAATGPLLRVHLFLVLVQGPLRDRLSLALGIARPIFPLVLWVDSGRRSVVIHGAVHTLGHIVLARAAVSLQHHALESESALSTVAWPAQLVCGILEGGGTLDGGGSRTAHPKGALELRVAVVLDLIGTCIILSSPTVRAALSTASDPVFLLIVLDIDSKRPPGARAGGLPQVRDAAAA